MVTHDPIHYKRLLEAIEMDDEPDEDHLDLMSSKARASLDHMIRTGFGGVSKEILELLKSYLDNSMTGTTPDRMSDSESEGLKELSGYVEVFELNEYTFLHIWALVKADWGEGFSEIGDYTPRHISEELRSILGHDVYGLIKHMPFETVTKITREMPQA